MSSLKLVLNVTTAEKCGGSLNVQYSKGHKTVSIDTIKNIAIPSRQNTRIGCGNSSIVGNLNMLIGNFTKQYPLPLNNHIHK